MKLILIPLTFILTLLTVNAISFDNKVTPKITENRGLTSNLTYTFTELRNAWRINYCHKDVNNRLKPEYSNIPITETRGNPTVVTSFDADLNCGNFTVTDVKLNDEIKLGTASTTIQFSSNEVQSESIDSFSENQFVLGWCDNTDKTVLFTTWKANGTNISGVIIADNDVGTCEAEGDVVKVSTLSNDTFVISWFDSDANAMKLQTFLINGTDFSQEIIVDDATGFGTIDTAKLNSTHFIAAWVDSTDGDVHYRKFNSSGNSTQPVQNVNTNIISNTRDVSIDTFNESAWIIMWTNLDVDDLIYSTYIDDVAIINNSIIDDSIAPYSEVDVTRINQTHFAYTYIDTVAGVGEVTWGILDINNVTHLAPSTIGASLPTSGENVQIDKINATDNVAIVFTDNSPQGAFINIIDFQNISIVNVTTYFDTAIVTDGIDVKSQGFCFSNMIVGGHNIWSANLSTDLSEWDGLCPIVAILNLTNLDVFLSKNPVEILEEFTLFANYTNTTDNAAIPNAVCIANSSIAGGGAAGFGRGVLGIGQLSTVDNAVHTQVQNIWGNNTLRVDIDGLPLGKSSYGINFRFHAHTTTPIDDLRVYATCHPDNLTFSNFTFVDQVNISEAVVSTSTENNTVWGFKNVVLIGASVASANCSILFESINSTSDNTWMVPDTVSTLNLNNSFTSADFGETYTLRSNANERSSFVDAGFGLDVPNETTMTFNTTSGLYFLPNIRHGRPFDFNDTVSCSADNFKDATDLVITNVQDNVAPIVQINSIIPDPATILTDNVTIIWSVNDPELLSSLINVSFPNGSLLIESTNKPLILNGTTLTVIGNYSVVAFANDTGGLFTLANDTFEVIKIKTNVSLTLNGIDNNITVTIPQLITPIFNQFNGSAVLTRNGTVIANNTAEELEVGFFNFTVAITQNATHQESIVTHFATLNTINESRAIYRSQIGDVFWIDELGELHFNENDYIKFIKNEFRFIISDVTRFCIDETGGYNGTCPI